MHIFRFEANVFHLIPSPALDDRIDEFGELIREHYNIPELGDPSSSTYVRHFTTLNPQHFYMAVPTGRNYGSRPNNA